nr:hypothetical protein [Tanacetum cinerariifolium]
MLAGGATATATAYEAYQLTSFHGHGGHKVSHVAHNMVLRMGGIGHFSSANMNMLLGHMYHHPPGQQMEVCMTEDKLQLKVVEAGKQSKYAEGSYLTQSRDETRSNKADIFLY